MDTKKLLLVNKRNLYNHSCSQTQQQTQDIDIQEEQIRIKMNLILKVLLKNYDVYSDFTGWDPLSPLKKLCVKYFLNRKIMGVLKKKQNCLWNWL